MKSAKILDSEDQFKLVVLIPFLLITFTIAWGILALYIFLPEGMSSLFGELTGNHPLFFLAVYAPAIAALSIIAIKAGLQGIRDFLKRLLIWRTNFGWYLFLFIGIPLIFYLGALLNGNLFETPFPFESLSALITPLFLSIIKGPVEEFGWRGFMLPILQRKIVPFYASIFIGIVWGLWHLPAFLLSGTQQSSWSFFPFFLGTIVISILMTALFNQSKGSILLAGVMHFQLMNPIWPDAAPYDSYILAVAAVIVTWIYRDMMFNRENGVKIVMQYKG